MPGLREANNVFGFRDLSDAEAVKNAAGPGKKAVIVGSGLVGMDAAYALLEQGINPVIVEMADRILQMCISDRDCIIENMYGDDGAGQPLWMHMDSVAFWAKD